MDKYNSDEIFLSAIDPTKEYYDADEADKFIDEKIQTNVALEQQNLDLKARLADCEERSENDHDLIELQRIEIENRELTIRQFIASLTKTLKKLFGNGNGKG